jgi:tetratricopeptide (TPR) repeat protein
MTNRMDIVLVGPALLIAVWPGVKSATFTEAAKTIFGGAFFWLAGFSVYLYLLIRSGVNPPFDWSHPADVTSFLAVITRKSYGSTLDLVSRNYSVGELFWPNIKYYARHLAENFNFALLFAAAGLFSEFSRNRRRFFATLALFIVPGPVFLFMANMPPNPHSLAIVEPYYLLPDMALAIWIAAGLAFAASLLSRLRPSAGGGPAKLSGGLPSSLRRWVVPAAAAAFIALALRHNLPRADRRTLFAAEDWSADVMKSSPISSTLVAKKDVQIFSLWYLQTVRGVRPDLRIVAQGLSGARWYRNSKRLWQPELKLFNLNGGGAGEWENFSKANPGGVYATMDSEFPNPARAGSRGLVSALSHTGGASDLWNFYSFRWLDRKYNDFFGRDLGTSYAQSVVARAAWLNNNGGLTAEDARRLELARIMDPDLPDAPLYLGFYYSAVKDWTLAGEYFRRSAGVYERLLALAREYYTLPALIESLSGAGAYAWLNYGVALEKTGDTPGAENSYKRALAANPGLADAHYNMAILYWNRDPSRVYEELQATLRLNPNHQQAGYYLGRMRH